MSFKEGSANDYVGVAITVHVADASHLLAEVRAARNRLERRDGSVGVSVSDAGRATEENASAYDHIVVGVAVYVAGARHRAGCIDPICSATRTPIGDAGRTTEKHESCGLSIVVAIGGDDDVVVYRHG